MYINRVKAVIFDMDGVLVDTMPFHYRALSLTLKKCGVRIFIEIMEPT